MDEMLDAILEGEDQNDVKCEREIKQFPRQFNQWINDNDERMRLAANRGTLPYFVRDNMNRVPLIKYNSYGDEWRRMWYYDTGGYLVVHTSRYENSQKNKNEKRKYDKEVAMCRVLVKNGHQIEMLEEVPGISSPDITFDKVKADLKRLSSHNNIIKEAKEAIKKQGAEIIIFEFTTMNSKILQALEHLKKLVIHGKYFVTGSNLLHDF